MAEHAGGRAPTLSWHGRIVPLGAALLIAAFVTDWLYWKTVQVQWETFSAWLITGGLVLAALAALALVADLLLRRDRPISPPRFLLLAAAAVLSILNAFVHSRDGYTAVAPSGIALSAVVAMLLVLAGIGGWEVLKPAVVAGERRA